MPAIDLTIPGHSPSDKLRDLTRDSAEPGCPRCWHETARAIITGDGLAGGELENALREMTARGDKSDIRPDWASVLPFLLGSVGEYHRHGAHQGGSRAVPTFAALVDKLGRAANQGK